MPTLPLFTPPSAAAHPSASRQVIAPGGMEWWHFDAGDEAHKLLIVVDVFAGSPFDPSYEKQVKRFLRRPTTVSPPDPRGFAQVSVAVYRRGACIAWLDEPASPGAFFASSETLDLRCPPVRVSCSGETIRIESAPAELFDSVGLSLDFIPGALVSRQFEIASLGRAGTFLHWVCGAPRYDVSGTVRYLDADGKAQALDFQGHGFHECMFGAGLSSRGLAGWTRRRVLSNGQSWISHKFTLEKSHGPEVFLAAAGSGNEPWHPIGAVDWPTLGAMGRPFRGETALHIQRSIVPVHQGDSSGHMLVETFGGDYRG